MGNRFFVGLLALSVLIAPKLSGQSIYLVSAGVSDYPGYDNDLTLPAEDARAMHRLYRKNSSATSVLLTNSNATKGNILKAMRKAYSNAKTNDIVVFYFSGHGYPGGFVAYDEYIRYEDVRVIFSSCKAKNKMIFADACFSGDMRDGESIGYIDSRNNIMLFLSCRSDEFSIETPYMMKNGFFTACLVRAMKGGADENRDRIITALELFEAVSQEVKDLSGGRQHPVMWGNFKDNMPVMVWK